MPAFEIGRKAPDLAKPVADTDDGSVRSWEGAGGRVPDLLRVAIPHGIDGDFESLVRALVPRDMDPRVGIRDMDIAHPGFGPDTVANPPDDSWRSKARSWRRRRCGEALRAATRSCRRLSRC